MKVQLCVRDPVKNERLAPEADAWWTYRNLILLAQGDGCLVHHPQILGHDVVVLQALVHLCIRILHNVNHFIKQMEL